MSITWTFTKDHIFTLGWVEPWLDPINIYSLVCNLDFKFRKVFFCDFSVCFKGRVYAFSGTA